MRHRHHVPQVLGSNAAVGAVAVSRQDTEVQVQKRRQEPQAPTEEARRRTGVAFSLVHNVFLSRAL